MKIYLRFCCVAVAFGLSACGASQTELRQAQTLSCTELARKIGQLEERRDDANMDSIMSTFEQALSKDKDDENAALVEGVVADIESDSADKQLEQYRKIFRQNRCY